MKYKFTIGVFALIFDNEDKILLCHRKDYDLWNLPGGTLEQGESPWEGVVREVLEETGLNVKVIKLTGVYNKPKNNEIVFSFLCGVVNGNIQPSNEADEIEYFNVNNIPNNFSPKQLEKISDYLNNKDLTVYRNQEGKSSIQLVKEGKL